MMDRSFTKAEWSVAEPRHNPALSKRRHVNPSRTIQLGIGGRTSVAGITGIAVAGDGRKSKYGRLGPRLGTAKAAVKNNVDSCWNTFILNLPKLDDFAKRPPTVMAPVLIWHP
jgi:hypothetical protein